MSSAAFGLACLGCLLLGFSLRRYYRHAWPGSTDYSQWCTFNRTLGCVFLFLALVPAIISHGTWSGVGVWLGVLILAALVQLLLLSYCPTRKWFISGASVVLVVVGFIAG
jgi:hypothetical protein